MNAINELMAEHEAVRLTLRILRSILKPAPIAVLTRRIT